ncbi:MAG TPA: hypothetical protein VLY21_05465 [Nitrososphaerales archaeon]|nr:hypothetical protein [Nitrososphaerales archaeon]
MQSRRMDRERAAALVLLVLGLAFVLVAEKLVFQTGCNAPNFIGCPMDFASWWATYWPNFVLMGAGLLFLSVGAFGAGAPELPPRLPAGVGLLLVGSVLLPPSIDFGLNAPVWMGSCPANGCAPWTLYQTWVNYWPSYAALALSCVLLSCGFWLAASGALEALRGDRWIHGAKVRFRGVAGLAGLGIGFCSGVVALILGEVEYGPFPPPSYYYPITYVAPWQGLLVMAPFLLAAGILLGGLGLTREGVVGPPALSQSE